MHPVIVRKHSRQRLELLFRIMIGRTTHHDHRSNLRHIPQHRNTQRLLFQTTVRPDFGLMKDITGNQNDIRVFLNGSLRQLIQLLHHIQKPGILAADFRAGKRTDVPVRCMQNLQSTHCNYLASLLSYALL